MRANSSTPYLRVVKNVVGVAHRDVDDGLDAVGLHRHGHVNLREVCLRSPAVIVRTEYDEVVEVVSKRERRRRKRWFLPEYDEVVEVVRGRVVYCRPQL